MTRTIAIIGGKGGVGKTTLTSNLASALAKLGQDVIAIDANMTTPNLGIHLGLHFAPHTLHHVLKGESKLNDSIYPHQAGFRLIPASMSVEDLEGVDVNRLQEITFNLIGKSDFVILDSAAGLGREAISALTASEEVLIITNPDLPSVADALKTVKLAEKLNKKIIGVVLNKVNRKEYELTKNEVEEMISYPVLAEVPEDKTLSKALFAKTPVVNFDPHSPAAKEFRRIAHTLVGVPFVEEKPFGFKLIDRLVTWINT